MLSLCIIAFVAVIAFIFQMKFKRTIFRVIFYFAVNLFFIEAIIYGYFIYLIYQGNCLLLMGNQRILDGLIKTRLSYSLYYSRGKKTYFNQIDNRLGHSVGRDKVFGKYTINHQGIRSTKDYSLFPDDNVLRIATFGNSHVFGDNVRNEETWQEVLGGMADHVEVLNFGVDSYGFGQSYLRYLNDGLAFNPHIIYFENFASGPHDRLNPKEIFNLKNFRFPYFYKVHFWIEDGKLLSRSITPYDYFNPKFRKKFIFEPLNIPIDSGIFSEKIFSVSNIGLLCKFYGIRALYRTNIEDFKKQESYEKVNEIMLNNLLATAHKNRTKILFFSEKGPDDLPLYLKNVLDAYKEDFVSADKTAFLHKIYARHNVAHHELMDTTMHFTPEGHKMFAEAILEVLKSHEWKTYDRTFRFDRRKNAFIATDLKK